MDLQSEVKVPELLPEKRIYFPELDGLRFFAFLLVFFHHREWYPIPAFSFFHEIGWIGVDLFFVLSSFLFTKLLIVEYEKIGTINIRKFYLRRIFRIWPLYFFIITIALSCFFACHYTMASLKIRLIGLFTFTDNIVSIFDGYNNLPFLSPLWSISYEEQFYLFIPFLILLLVRISNTKKIVLFFAVFIVFNSIKLLFIRLQLPSLTIWVLPVTHFESMLFGIVIGFGGFDFIAKRIKSLFLILLSFLCVYLYTQCTPITARGQDLIISYLFIGLSTAFVLLAVINSAYLKTILSHPILVFLGKRSYGLYVYHMLGNKLVDFVPFIFPKAPHTAVTTFLYSLFITIVLSIISYVLIEKPFLKLKKKFEIVKSRPI